jgi:hypothetical protein
MKVNTYKVTATQEIVYQVCIKAKDQFEAKKIFDGLDHDNFRYNRLNIKPAVRGSACITYCPNVSEIKEVK